MFFGFFLNQVHLLFLYELVCICWPLHEKRETETCDDNWKDLRKVDRNIAREILNSIFFKGVSTSIDVC